jgi:hypothetical protein
MTWALVIAGVTAAVGVAGAVQQGRAAEANAQFQADQFNANAKATRAEASVAEDDQREKARQVIGTQMAAQAGSGVQLNGSAADLLKQSLFNAESDAQRIRYEGENRARGFSNQATGALFEGSLKKKESKLNAVGALVGGAGKAYGAYSKMGG